MFTKHFQIVLILYILLLCFRSITTFAMSNEDRISIHSNMSSSDSLDHDPGITGSTTNDESDESSSSNSFSDSHIQAMTTQSSSDSNATESEHSTESDMDAHDSSEEQQNDSSVFQFQLTAQPNSESHIITSPTGRRYIAHIFEQGAAGQQVPTPQNNEEGNMARTLCLNLLNELVKGSYQLIKCKKKKPAQDKLNHINYVEKSIEKAECSDKPEVCIYDKGSSGLEMESNTEETGASLSSGLHLSSSNEPPYKKAKFGWQIKRSQDDMPNNEENTEISNTSFSATEYNDVSCSTQQKDSLCDSELSSVIPDTDIKTNDCDSLSNKLAMSSHKTNIENANSDVEQQKQIKKQLVDNLNNTFSVNSKQPAPLKLQAKNAVANGLLDQQVLSTNQQDSLEDCNEINPQASEELSGSLNRHKQYQNAHIAKSIVDNAINKTLEEMGLSPNATGNQARDHYTSQQQRIEDVGVAQVIRERGLQGDNAGTYERSFPTLHQPPVTLSSAQRLNPLVSRLTQVTENIFVQNIQHGLRFSARINLGDVTAPPAVIHNDTENISTIPNSQVDATMVEDSTQEIDGADLVQCNISNMKPITDHESAEEVENLKVDTDIEQIEKECLSANYILDRAINAAVSEKGLHF